MDDTFDLNDYCASKNYEVTWLKGVTLIPADDTTMTTMEPKPEDKCDISDHIDRLRTIAEENGIKHSTWSFDDFEEPVRDFSKPHGFTASMVDSGCGHNSHCYYMKLHKNKPTTPVQLIGDTWLDVWKSIDRHIAQKECGHRFIETIEQKGDTLVVGCGS